MVTIYFWDAGVCPHFSSCECWHVLGTGKVYIVWIPRDWFRATHFEAVGQIKPMLTPSLPFKNDMVTSSSSRQLPSRKPAIALGPLSVLCQSLMGKGQRVDTVAIYSSFWDGGLPSSTRAGRLPYRDMRIRAKQLSSWACWWMHDLLFVFLRVSIPGPRWDNRWLISILFVMVTSPWSILP